MDTPTKTEKARIAILDDHPLVREGLCQVINRQPDMECVGHIAQRSELEKFLAEKKPHLLTVDIRLTDADGLELLKIIKLQHESLRTLVLSQCDETLYAERALKAGARGYVMKERATEEVLAAIRTILADGIYVSPRIAALALNKMIGNGTSNLRSVQNLSDRELQVLQLFGAGLGTRQIATRLFLSVKTVETHRENIKHKLAIGTAAELVRFASEWVNGQPSNHALESFNGLKRLLL